MAVLAKEGMEREDNQISDSALPTGNSTRHTPNFSTSSLWFSCEGSGLKHLVQNSRSSYIHTVLVLRMAHRIWKETKQQPGTAGPGNMLAVA